MKYKIGDKVKVKKRLVIDRDYNDVCFVYDMKDYKGQELIIRDIKTEEDEDGTHIIYRTIGNEWCWGEDMFEKHNSSMKELLE